MSDSENEELFTTRMRKATRKIHSISDALVNAKFALSLRDEKVWGGGLFVFYHIFSYLEDARQRLNMEDFNKLQVHEILERKQAFKEDLKHYLGDNWQSTPKSKELENYLQHLQDLESENPSLLMAYVYHLYLGLLSGGQILAKKRKMFGDSTPESALPELSDETPSSDPSISTDQENISGNKKQELKSIDPVINLLEDDGRMTSPPLTPCSEPSLPTNQEKISENEKEESKSTDPVINLLEDHVEMTSEKVLTVDTPEPTLTSLSDEPAPLTISPSSELSTSTHLDNISGNEKEKSIWADNAGVLDLHEDYVIMTSPLEINNSEKVLTVDTPEPALPALSDEPAPLPISPSSKLSIPTNQDNISGNEKEGSKSRDHVINLLEDDGKMTSPLEINNSEKVLTVDTPEPALPALSDEPAPLPISPSSKLSIPTNQDNISGNEKEGSKSRDHVINLLEDDGKMTSPLEINDSEKVLTVDTPEPTLTSLSEEPAPLTISPSSELSTSTNLDNISGNEKEKSIWADNAGVLDLHEDYVIMTSPLEINNSEKVLTVDTPEPALPALSDEPAPLPISPSSKLSISTNQDNINGNEKEESKSKDPIINFLEYDGEMSPLEINDSEKVLTVDTPEPTLIALSDEPAAPLPTSPSSEPSKPTNQEKISGNEKEELKSTDPVINLLEHDGKITSSLEINDSEKVLTVQTSAKLSEAETVATTVKELYGKGPKKPSDVSLELWNSMSISQRRKFIKKQIKTKDSVQKESDTAASEEKNTAQELGQVKQGNINFQTLSKPMASIPVIKLEDKEPNIPNFITLEKWNSMTKTQRKKLKMKMKASSKVLVIKAPSEQKNTAHESVHVQQEKETSKELPKIISSITVKGPTIQDSVSVEERNAKTELNPQNIMLSKKISKLNEPVQVKPETNASRLSLEEKFKIYLKSSPKTEVKDKNRFVPVSVEEWNSMSKSQRQKLRKKEIKKSAKINKKATGSVSTENSKEIPKNNLSTATEVKTLEKTIPSSLGIYLKSSPKTEVKDKNRFVPVSVEEWSSMSKKKRQKLRKKEMKKSAEKNKKNVEIDKNVLPNVTGPVFTVNSKEVPKNNLFKATEVKTLDPTLTSSAASLSKSQKRKMKKKEKSLNQPTADPSSNESTEEPPVKINTELGLSRKMTPVEQKLSKNLKRRLRTIKVGQSKKAATGYKNSTPSLPLATRVDTSVYPIYHDPSDIGQRQVAESTVKNSEGNFAKPKDVSTRYHEQERKKRLLKLIHDEEQRIAQLLAAKTKISTPNESLGSDTLRISSVPPRVTKRKYSDRQLDEQDEEYSVKRTRSSREILSEETMTLNTPNKPFPAQPNFPRQPIPSAHERMTMENNSFVNEHTNFSPNAHAYVNEDSRRVFPNQDRQYPQVLANTNPQQPMWALPNEVREEPYSLVNKDRDIRHTQADVEKMPYMHNTRSGDNARVYSCDRTNRSMRNPWFENHEQSKKFIFVDDLDDECCVAITNVTNQMFTKAKLASIRFRLVEALMNCSPSRHVPSFRQVITTPKYINVWCEDLFTVEWLRHTIASMEDYPKLIVCKQSELPKRTNEIFFSVPNEPGTGVTDLITRIQIQNVKCLDVDSWTLIRVQRSNMVGDFEWEFNYEISDEEREKLTRLNNCILYKSGMIRVDMKS